MQCDTGEYSSARRTSRTEQISTTIVAGEERWGKIKGRIIWATLSNRRKRVGFFWRGRRNAGLFEDQIGGEIGPWRLTGEGGKGDRKIKPLGDENRPPARSVVNFLGQNLSEERNQAVSKKGLKKSWGERTDIRKLVLLFTDARDRWREG